MNCLNCGKELQMTEGRRLKVYCNAACRVAYFKKKNKKSDTPSNYVLRKTHESVVEKLQSRINALEAQISSQASSHINHHKKEEMPPIQASSTNKSQKPERLDGESGIDYAIRLKELGF